jgi:NADPH:quinone reductase-like Zn-dependent oxidoreductase
MEFAGEVESAGKAATRFAENDRGFGSTGFKFGAHAEYVSMPEDGTLGPDSSPLRSRTLEEWPHYGLYIPHKPGI